MQAAAAMRTSGTASLLKTESLTVRLISDPPGVIDSPARPYAAVVIHVGPSVQIGCRRGGRNYRGLTVHGDVDIIPPGMTSRWELMQDDTALVVGVDSALLSTLAEERGLDPRRVEIVNRFQARDPRIEQIGWALKSQLDAAPPAIRIYTDTLAAALAERLLEGHSSAASAREARLSMSGRKLRQVVSYIEDNLIRDLSLQELAAVAGLGISQFKKVFRESVGLPVHRYILQRRVDRARALLGDGRRTIGQIAAETGFAHQSHLARHMRRVTGLQPRRLRENLYRE